jgi:diaminohydroxyphosphoribosylaminopyrimidine deaminase / 5-amino-6-(5-phosphoribosylamino)uracil reductase
MRHSEKHLATGMFADASAPGGGDLQHWQVTNWDELQFCLAHTAAFRRRMRRPFVTVSYAQSLDGSIAFSSRQPIRLSGPLSTVLTHRLRAGFDAILVGIETVLADNPLLTVRCVEGRNPQPVVLDTHLRIPVQSNLVQRSDLSSWVVGGLNSAHERMDTLTRAGVTVLPCHLGGDGKIDLQHLMRLLAEKGVNSLMVEGGARVITSFISAGLVDQFVITIAPTLIGGLPVIDSAGLQPFAQVRLDRVHYQQLGEDLILWAKPGEMRS